MAAKQKQFKKENYNDVCDFLMKHTVEDKSQINWNWARWEWMYFHPEFDQELMGTIGLWYDQEELVAIATYDMYNGESAFVIADGHAYLEDEIIAYSLQTFSDEAGLGIAVNENHLETIHKLEAAGFVQHENTENVLVKNLDTADFTYTLAKNFHCANINGLDDVVNYTEVLWKGMDHEGEVPVDEATIKEHKRMLSAEHSNYHFHVYVAGGEQWVAFCSCWYLPGTDYAYVEPVCTLPKFRNQGLGKVVVLEALKRCYVAGAKEAYVISDNEFYKTLGFTQHAHYHFYWKK